jgi:hypothetical protein
MQVLTMANIIHCDGVTLRQQMKSYMPSEVIGSQYEWARENPSAADWAIWRRGLLLLTSTSKKLPFFKKLSRWLTTPHKQWEWHYSPSRDVLYWLYNDATHKYHPLSSTRRGMFIRRQAHQDPLPPDASYAMTKPDAWRRTFMMGFAMLIDQIQ